MGYPMQVKINFLCRDSILAAPLCLDLVLLIDAAARDGRYGTQRFLSFFLKSPQHDYTQGEVPENHLFRQYTNLKNAIREMGVTRPTKRWTDFSAPPLHTERDTSLRRGAAPGVPLFVRALHRRLSAKTIAAI